MDIDDTRETILDKIDMALAAIDKRQSPEFNEQVSCIVCNLAQAYSCLQES